MIALLHACNYDQEIRDSYNQNQNIMKTVSFQWEHDDVERSKHIVHRSVDTGDVEGVIPPQIVPDN